jgi:hypothetical protein
VEGLLETRPAGRVEVADELLELPCCRVDVLDLLLEVDVALLEDLLLLDRLEVHVAELAKLVTQLLGLLAGGLAIDRLERSVGFALQVPRVGPGEVQVDL